MPNKLAMLRAWSWKEARESLWKILGVLACYLMVAFIAEARIEPEAVQMGMWWVSLILPGVIAVSVLSSEHWQRTTRTMEALPLGRAPIYAIKWAWGLATLWIPTALALAIAIGVMHASAKSPVLSNHYLLTGALWSFEVFASSGALYAWCMLAGARWERSFAPVAVVLFVNMVMLIGGGEWALRWPWIVFPLSIRQAIESPATAMHVGSIQALVMLLLAGLAMANWSRPAPRRERGLALAGPLSLTKLRPWRWPVARKTWIEMRLPVVGAWTITGLLMPGWAIWAIATNADLTSWRGFMQLDNAVVLATIAALALAVGMGARTGATRAVESKSFWHTRAIGVGRYFWTQALLESAALLALALWPALLVQALHTWWRLEPYRSPGLQNAVNLASGVEQLMLVTILTLYAVALMLGALTRSVILSTVLTIGVAVAGDMAISLLFVQPWLRRSAVLPQESSGETAVYFLLFATAALTALLLARFFFQFRLFTPRHPAATP